MTSVIPSCTVFKTTLNEKNCFTDQELRSEMIQLKNFLYLVENYIFKLKEGKKISSLVCYLEDVEIMQYYNQFLLTGEQKILTGDILNEENLEEHFFALAYAYSKLENKEVCIEAKKLNPYLKQMKRKK